MTQSPHQLGDFLADAPAGSRGSTNSAPDTPSRSRKECRSARSSTKRTCRTGEDVWSSTWMSTISTLVQPADRTPGTARKSRGLPAQLDDAPSSSRGRGSGQRSRGRRRIVHEPAGRAAHRSGASRHFTTASRSTSRRPRGNEKALRQKASKRAPIGRCPSSSSTRPYGCSPKTPLPFKEPTAKRSRSTSLPAAACTLVAAAPVGSAT